MNEELSDRRRRRRYEDPCALTHRRLHPRPAYCTDDMASIQEERDQHHAQGEANYESTMWFVQMDWDDAQVLVHSRLFPHHARWNLMNDQYTLQSRYIESGRVEIRMCTSRTCMKQPSIDSFGMRLKKHWSNKWCEVPMRLPCGVRTEEDHATKRTKRLSSEFMSQEKSMGATMYTAHHTQDVYLASQPSLFHHMKQMRKK